eukprot:6330641-Karenia_brevis.AAC.1
MPSREGREYLQKIDVRGCRHEEVAAWLWVVMYVLNQGKQMEVDSAGFPTERQQRAAGLLAVQ